MKPHTVLREAADSARLKPAERPTLAAVDARRSQLWLVSLVVSLSLGAVLLLVGVAGPASGPTSSWGLRVGAVLVVVALALHVVEQERRLRRVTRMLVDEQTRTQHLEHLTTHDPVTGTLNRSAFEERVGSALAHSRRHGSAFAVLVIDLRLDVRAHRRDAAMVEAATIVSRAVRGEDAVGRLGPDRFAVLAVGAESCTSIRQFAERLCHRLRDPLPVASGPVPVRPSAGGVVRLGGRKDGPGDVIRDAEMAANLARRRGGEHIELYDRVVAPLNAVRAGG